MIEHFKKIKPSLTDLTPEEQLYLHERIRASRFISKQSYKKKSQSSQQKRNKKLNDLIKNMSDEELEILLKEIE